MTDANIKTEVTLRYFAWLRERAGVSEERIALPPDIQPVGATRSIRLSQSPRRSASP